MRKPKPTRGHIYFPPDSKVKENIAKEADKRGNPWSFSSVAYEQLEKEYGEK